MHVSPRRGAVMRGRRRGAHLLARPRLIMCKEGGGRTFEHRRVLGKLLAALALVRPQLSLHSVLVRIHAHRVHCMLPAPRARDHRDTPSQAAGCVSASLPCSPPGRRCAFRSTANICEPVLYKDSSTKAHHQQAHRRCASASPCIISRGQAGRGDCGHGVHRWQLASRASWNELAPRAYPTPNGRTHLPPSRSHSLLG